MSDKNKNLDKILKTFSAEMLEIDSLDRAFFLQQVGMVKTASRVQSKKFERALRKTARNLGIRLSPLDVKALQDEIESIAFDEEKPFIETSVRIATSHDGSSILCDLGDSDGNVVQLSKIEGKARLVEDKSVTNGVYFRRPDTILPMVKPEFHTDWKIKLDALRQYINTDKVTFYILLGYLSYVMSHPKDQGLPYPVLIIQGHQGSGKTFFCNNIIRALIDPNSNASLRLPKREEDLAIQLDHTYLAVYDNLRSFSREFSDLLAQVATKTGFAPRQHHSYDDLASKSLHGALVMNGIHEFVKEPDLAERCFRVKLNVMKPEERKTQTQLKSEFDILLPKIMGALFTLAAKAMLEVENCDVKFPARLMDFSKWLAAIEKVLGMPEGALQKAYLANVNETMASGTADESLTLALQKLLKNRVEPWKGSASSLLELLQEHESSYSLPKGAGALSQRLKGQESGLKANGIHLAFGRGKERYIIVSNKKLAA